ncbi:hypothetical protein G6O69_13970 [Pseudenhygromyxa sp. WMMC2535]|uniref:hypothetical protein n=1 Tax=Pseudenhygromyxa sp. WMMC2535 TaxID=2712867 RepID=UPI0015555D5A|nr:hypothetical protein [Pseudenhygromyxa sp. WMMC2535]NVB38944.1 hypothetical protein [Pseudenhygromyxa sp. WMMC2535]
MAKAHAKTIALALAGFCTFGLWKVGSALFADDGAQAAKHLVNRPWIDHVPEDGRDMIGHLVVLEHPKGHFGATGRSSSWRHRVEVFKWEQHGDALHFFFPQDRVRSAVEVRTWACKGEAPAPFDLCLELRARNGRSMTLYSRKDWEIDVRDVGGSLAALDVPGLGEGALVELDEGAAEALEALDGESWEARELAL